MMKTKPDFRSQTFVLILVLVVAFYLWSQHQEVKRLRQAANQQNQSYWYLQSVTYQSNRAFKQQTKLVNELVRRTPQIDPSIVLVIEKLDRLAELYTPLLPKVAIEIDSACKLLRADQAIHSVATMAKILENVLKTWLVKDDEFRKRYEKKPSINFGNLIAYAADKKLCTVKEVAFLKELKEIRNESVHEVAVQKPKVYLISCQEKCVDFMKRIIPRLTMA